MAVPLIALAVVLAIMILFPMWATKNRKKKNKNWERPAR
jgi:hypothetical protein